MIKFFRRVFRRFRRRSHTIPDEDVLQSLLDHKEFNCSICEDVFTDPVTTPCGHNFCKRCITQHWNSEFKCDCPQCGKVFKKRPLVRVNTSLSEVVAEFISAIKPGEVPCDVCTGTKVKAVKSCRVCLASYCQTHLEPHLTVSVLKNHQLMEPVEDLEVRMCPKHHKPLEIFCISEQTSVCSICAVLEHKTHKIAPLNEYEAQQMELRNTEDEIQKRRVKMEEILESVEKSKAAADRKKAEGVEAFTALMKDVERALNQLKQTTEEEEEARQKQAEGLLNQLEEEICELTKKSSEVQQLLHSEDLLQGFSPLKAAPPTKDWTEVNVPPSSYEGTVVRALAQLEQTVHRQMMKLSQAEFKSKQEFAVDVTLDPDSAHAKLIVSQDGKQVRHDYMIDNFSNRPDSFYPGLSVLGKQSFSSGKFYFEVQVKGKTDWDLGVCRESVNRRGKIIMTPLKGFWTISLRNENQFCACEKPYVSLSLRPVPQKVGVFVDYEEGLVSFYDVDAAALIYSFTDCCFTDRLLPFFSPGHNYFGNNYAPLIICPVNQTVSFVFSMKHNPVSKHFVREIDG